MNFEVVAYKRYHITDGLSKDQRSSFSFYVRSDYNLNARLINGLEGEVEEKCATVATFKYEYDTNRITLVLSRSVVDIHGKAYLSRKKFFNLIIILRKIE